MTLSIVKINDMEFEGRCTVCQREGLRWVATLSDGTGVGLECAKKVLGFKPKPVTYQWVPLYTAIAEYREGGHAWVLWQRKNGTETRETRNGHLMAVGGCRADWAKRGWLA